jgi:DNA-binding MarR family transcriptional regulator
MSGVDHLHEVLWTIRPLQQYTAKVLAEALTDVEVSLPERAVLEQLNASGESTVPQIARSLLLPRQVVQRLADAAHERGLIEFVPNPAHRRSRLLRLTVSGRQVFDQILAQEMQLLAPVAETLEAKDVEACARVMTALTAAMHAMAQHLGDEPDR